MGEDESWKLVPHGGSHGEDVSPPATCGCSWGQGTRLGTGIQLWTPGGVNGDTAMDVGHNWGQGCG